MKRILILVFTMMAFQIYADPIIEGADNTFIITCRREGPGGVISYPSVGNVSVRVRRIRGQALPRVSVSGSAMVRSETFDQGTGTFSVCGVLNSVSVSSQIGGGISIQSESDQVQLQENSDRRTQPKGGGEASPMRSKE